MVTLNVPDMSCGHCKASVEQALTALDPKAKVVVDLVGRRVAVDSGQGVAAMVAALDAVGFVAEPI